MKKDAKQPTLERYKEIKKILQLCQQIDNSRKLTNFQKHNLPRLNQGEIDNLNKLIYKKKKKLLVNKIPGPDRFREILTNIKRKGNSYPSQTIPKN